MDQAHVERLDALKDQLGRVILGKPEAIEAIAVCLLSGGHILMEDVPGVGKTTLAKALAQSLAADFKRVQFTPDLLPTDILGSSVYSPRDGSFTFKPGPIFTNILLADEINRASPRTQSSLLEAMSERQVSIEGTTHVLPAPFLVIATQNPIEFHGTYPLPEAQLDRFGMRDQPRLSRGRARGRRPLQPVPPPPARRRERGRGRGRDRWPCRRRSRAVRVDRQIGRYIVDLADATRQHPSLKMGCSPRGTLTLFRMTQARAFVERPRLRDPRGREGGGGAHPGPPPGPRHQGQVLGRAKGGPRARGARHGAGRGLSVPLAGRKRTVLLRSPILELRPAPLRGAPDRARALPALGHGPPRRPRARHPAHPGLRRSSRSAAGALLLASVFWLARAPRVRFECPLPDRATAGAPLALRARIEAPAGRRASDLRALLSPAPLLEQQHRLRAARGLPRPRRRTSSERCASSSRSRAAAATCCAGPRSARTDPLRLATGRAVALPDQALSSTRASTRMDDFMIPLGRRYQPGGIPLSSSTRRRRSSSWARATTARATRSRASTGGPGRGAAEPVVKEYQEEYFCRIAIILDTFVPRKPTAAGERVFEAAISVVASIADYFSRSEYVVDILAAGPDVYEVSAGRSLAYLENILDVLACLEPCPDPPFQTIGPAPLREARPDHDRGGRAPGLGRAAREFPAPGEGARHRRARGDRARGAHDQALGERRGAGGRRA